MNPADFRTPPRKFSPVAFWFWNSRMDPDELRRQVREMVEKGVYGGFMHARAGLLTEYLSDEWWRAIEATVDEAARTGFYAWIYDEYAWPSGLCGAAGHGSHQPYSKVLEIGGERFMGKALVPTTHDITPDGSIDAAPEGVVAAVAFTERDGHVVEPSLAEVTISADGRVDGAGEAQRVMAFRVHVLSHRADYLNREGIRTFIDLTHEEYAKRCGEHFNGAIPGVFFDEIHNDGRPLVWTDRFLAEFETRRGFDLKKFLPLLILPGGPHTTYVRCAYFDVVTALYEESFFQQISEWCGAHAIRHTGHTEEFFHGHPLAQGDYFRTMRHLQIPGSDHHGFRYAWPRAVHAYEQKPLSSVSHLYGKERSMTESMGGAGWGLDFETARDGANLLHAYGTTMVTLHGLHYAMDTPVGMDDWPNSWFYQNPYWKYFKRYADYVSRCSSVLSAGHHVADVAVAYPIVSLYADTENGGMTPPGLQTSDRGHEIMDHLAAAQLDFDMIDDESVRRAEVADGALCVAGERYRALVLPPLSAASRRGVTRWAEFVRSGGVIVAMERLPMHSPEAGDHDTHVIGAINDIFGLDPKAAGEVTGAHVNEFEGGGAAVFVPPCEDPHAAVIEALRARLDVDFVVRGGAEGVRYVHRAVDGRDVYFVANSSGEARVLSLSLRATGGVERWSPADGRVYAVPTAREVGGRTELELDVAPHEGTFLVVGGEPSEEHAPPVAADGEEIARLDDWTFIASRDELKDTWTPELDEAALELPVMHVMHAGPGEGVGWESPEFDDAEWPREKLVEANDAGLVAGRYVSPWRAHWITFRANERQTANRPAMFFRRRFTLDAAPGSARLCASGAAEFELFVNGAPIASGSDPLAPVTVDVTDALRAGENVIAAHVKASASDPHPGALSYRPIGPRTLPSLLCEGEIDGDILVASDATWRATDAAGEGWQALAFDDAGWIDAWERGRPPVHPWGDVPRMGGPTPWPLDVWYRGRVPDGAVSVRLPDVRGAATVYLDGEPAGEGDIDCAGRSCLAIRVRCTGPTDGLAAAPVFTLQPTAAALTPWSEKGLDWHSGYGMYRATVTLPVLTGRVALDLGAVKHFAEVWVNGELADTCVWRPFVADITDHVREGGNEITVVVANTLANEMRWNIFDGVRALVWNRYWHEDQLERDSAQFVSGLLGPVRVLAKG